MVIKSKSSLRLKSSKLKAYIFKRVPLALPKQLELLRGNINAIPMLYWKIIKIVHWDTLVNSSATYKTDHKIYYIS